MAASEFGKIERKDAIILLILALGSGGLFTYNSLHPILQIIIVAFLLVHAVKNPFLCLADFIITQRYISELYTSYISVALMGLVCISFIISNFRMFRRMRMGLAVLIGIPLIAISTFVGVQASMTTGLLMALILILVVVVINRSSKVSRDDVALLAYAYFCSALSVGFYFLISIVTNTNVFKYGRLNFLGDIKPVAFSAFIPLLLLICTKIEGKRCFENISAPLLDYTLMAIYSGIIILTAARGMIFAGLIAIGIEMLFTKRKMRAIWKVIPIALFGIALVIMTMDSNTLRVWRIFDFGSTDFDDMNGRTGIWMEYLQLYGRSNLIRKIIGFGPGHGGRLIPSGYYTHSAFLDFLISYGLIGFLTMFYYEIKGMLKLIRNKDLVLIVVMFFSIIAEATHGSSANFALFILQAFLMLCVFATPNNTESNKEVAK